MAPGVHALSICVVSIALKTSLLTFLFSGLASWSLYAEGLAVHGKTVHTMAGASLTEGVVLIADGKITAIGTASEVAIPDNFTKIEAEVVMPGIIDAHSTVGLSGILNYDHDQEQIEKSSPIQPELRAIDAYNPRDPLVNWVRDFGVTTINAGHAPGTVVSGQAMIIKTNRKNLTDGPTVPFSMVMATLGADSLAAESSSVPGTRAKAVAVLRAELIKAQAYAAKAKESDPNKHPERDLRLEALSEVLAKQVPLLITAHRHQDIQAALRLATEFDIKLILDGASEAYLMLDEIKASGVPVIVHPTMMRSAGDRENMTFQNAKLLQEKGILFALQSGFEAYVPKTRVVLFEAAMAAAYGLPKEAALQSITTNAAQILGIRDRVGSLAVGKDADLALFDGDPFEYTSHCVGVVIDGEQVSITSR